MRPFLVLFATATLMMGCASVSESRFNPFNWFGESSSTEQTVAASEEPSDPRPLVEQVTALLVEPTPSGAIIRATGLPPRQGWYDGALVPVSDGPVDGVLAFRFRAFPPPDATPVSSVQSRELRAAIAVSQAELAATRVVQVIGASNIRTARR